LYHDNKKNHRKEGTVNLLTEEPHMKHVLCRETSLAQQRT
jgi:hypothetical protein